MTRTVCVLVAAHAAAYLSLASDRPPGLTGEFLRSDGGLAVR